MLTCYVLEEGRNASREGSSFDLRPSSSVTFNQNRSTSQSGLRKRPRLSVTALGQPCLSVMELDPLDFGQPGPSQPPTLRRPLALDLLNVRQPLDPGSAWFQAQPRASTSTSFDRSIQVNGQEKEEETALLKELRRTLGPRSTDAPPSSSSPSRPLSISRLLPGSPSRTERLTWQGNKVVWTRGVELVRSFTFESDEIVQVVAFGSFDASSPNSGSLLQRRKSSIEGEETSFVGAGGGPTSGKRRRSTVGGPKKGPRVSEGASFVRQSTHPSVGPHVLSTLAEPALPRSSSPARSTNLPPKKERREQAVCFLLSTSLVVHLSSGARHLVTLPHEMAEMHALPSGGLAVRGSSTRVEDAEAGAGWYVVRHPLNGLREVDEEEEAQMLLHLQDGPSTGLQDGPLSVHLRLDGQHVETGSARDGSVIFSSESRQLGDVVDTLHPASSTPVRVRLPSLDRVDPLVRTCLEMLDGPLGQSNLCALRLECLQWASTKRLRDAGGQEEFKSFAETLLELLGIQRQTSHSSLESETPWERMARVNAQSEDPALRALSASAPPSSSKTSALFLSPQADLSLIASVALSLHLLAEDFKLDMLHFHWLRPLGGLAMQLASVLGRQDWVDYWFRQGCPLNDLSTVLAERASLLLVSSLWVRIAHVVRLSVSQKTPLPCCLLLPTYTVISEQSSRARRLHPGRPSRLDRPSPQPSSTSTRRSLPSPPPPPLKARSKSSTNSSRTGSPRSACSDFRSGLRSRCSRPSRRVRLHRLPAGRRPCSS